MPDSTRSLDDKQVIEINADLTTTVDLTLACKLNENAGIAFIGDTKKGKFDITDSVAQEFLGVPVNPNGRPNSDVLRPSINASDIAGRPRGMWIVDFGTDAREPEAALYEMPFEYVRNYVKPARNQVRNALERSKWWLHGRPAPDFREATSGLGRYIATPRVSKHRIFVWVSADTLPDNAVVVFAFQFRLPNGHTSLFAA